MNVKKYSFTIVIFLFLFNRIRNGIEFIFTPHPECIFQRKFKDHSYGGGIVF